MEDATLVKRTSTTLFILRSKADGKEYPLRGEMLVGREVECAIPLKSGHISRYHAKINVSSSGVYVEDLHSTNGTFINGIKIKGRVRLNVGDEVGFDDIMFRLTTSASGREADTMIASKVQQAIDTATRLPYQPEPAKPITPSKPEEQAQPNRKAFDPSISQVISAIDLDGPMSLKQPLPALSEFEQQVDRRFDELDALMAGTSFPPKPKAPEVKVPTDMPNGPKIISPNSAAPKLKAKPVEDSAKPAIKENPIVTPSLPQNPKEAVAKVSTPTPQRPIRPTIKPPAAIALEANERTHLLSDDDADRLVSRNNNGQEVRLGSGPRLIVTTAPLRGKMFSLAEIPSSGSFQIGREHKAEVFLTDKTISADHARITKVNDAYVIAATHAKNGMLVNGVRTNRVYLRHDDKIQIGRMELVFKNDTPRHGSLPGSKGEDALLGGAQGRRYSIIVTVIALIVLIGAIITTSK